MHYRNKLRYCRNNIIVKGKPNHFNSNGSGYSFGNKDIYGMIKKLSISTYTDKNTRARMKWKNQYVYLVP